MSECVNCKQTPEFKMPEEVLRRANPPGLAAPDYVATDFSARHTLPSPADADAHYRKLKIDPFEYSMSNGLDALQHTIVKYVTRYRDKGGLADLAKARATLNRLIEWEDRHGA